MKYHITILMTYQNQGFIRYYSPSFGDSQHPGQSLIQIEITYIHMYKTKNLI